MPSYKWTVPEDFSDSVRLDSYIARVFPSMNRSKLKAGLTELSVNGKKEKVSYKVKAKDQIILQWEDNVPDDIEAENIPLKIIYEDKNVCVIDKEQGMVTHPAMGNWSGTLVNALLYHWGREKISSLNEGSLAEKLEKRRPGIVHRLDKDTSGIIITAKNRESEDFLHTQFLNHSNIQKEYICICRGRPHSKKGKIVTNITRDSKDRKKFKATLDTNQGKKAISSYVCIACYGEYSLMKVRIFTGRTHQIRVHMKYINCPILGDSLYTGKDKIFPDAKLMLHSRMLKINIPDENNEGSSKRMCFTSHTPERFLSVLKKLHKLYPKTIL